MASVDVSVSSDLEPEHAWALASNLDRFGERLTIFAGWKSVVPDDIEVGTRNLIDAARAGGARRFVVQSISFAYVPDSPTPHTEEMELVAPSLVSMERQVLESPMHGVVLRYGKFYGPGTGFDAPAPGGALHVDSAAYAAFLALTHGAPGVYNVAEDDGTVSSLKAVRELGWDPGFRLT